MFDGVYSECVPPALALLTDGTHSTINENLLCGTRKY